MLHTKVKEHLDACEECRRYAAAVTGRAGGRKTKRLGLAKNRAAMAAGGKKGSHADKVRAARLGARARWRQ